jgi:hypothetical protein
MLREERKEPEIKASIICREHVGGSLLHKLTETEKWANDNQQSNNPPPFFRPKSGAEKCHQCRQTERDLIAVRKSHTSFDREFPSESPQ